MPEHKSRQANQAQVLEGFKHIQHPEVHSIQSKYGWNRIAKHLFMNVTMQLITYEKNNLTSKSKMEPKSREGQWEVRHIGTKLDPLLNTKQIYNILKYK